MKTTRTLLAIVAAGMIPLAAGQADAGDFFSVGIHVGGQSHAVPLTPLWNNQGIASLGGGAGTGRYFKIAVGHGQTYLNVLTTGGLGDSDLYLAYGRLPTPKDHQYASNGGGTEEQVSILYPKPGAWYVLVHSFSGYRNVSLLGSFWRQDDYGPARPDRVNTQVRIVWGDYGSRRPLEGLVSFIVGRLRNRQAVRHHAIGDRRHEDGQRYAARPRPVVTPPVVRPARRETARPDAVVRRPAPVVRPRAVTPPPKVERRPEPTRRLALDTPRKAARKPVSTPTRTQVRKQVQTTTTVARAAQPRSGTPARIAEARTRKQASPSMNRSDRKRAGR